MQSEWNGIDRTSTSYAPWTVVEAVPVRLIRGKDY